MTAKAAVAVQCLPYDQVKAPKIATTVAPVAGSAHGWPNRYGGAELLRTWLADAVNALAKARELIAGEEQ